MGELGCHFEVYRNNELTVEELKICREDEKKVETLTKAMEVDAKKMRREVAAMEKDVAALRVEKDQENRAKRFSHNKSPSNTPQILAGRSAGRSGGLTKTTQ